MRHDSVKHVITDFCSKAGYKGVEEEPHLQPLPDDMKRRRSNGTIRPEDSDDARLDVMAIGVWGPLQRAFFDVRVTNPLAPSYVSTPLQQHLKNQENEKKTAYGRRVVETEKASFTPLVFTVAGACGKECDVFLKRLSADIARKTNEHQSVVMSDIRTRLSYTLLHANTISLRGPHLKTSTRKPTCNPEPDYQVVHAEARFLAE